MAVGLYARGAPNEEGRKGEEKREEKKKEEEGGGNSFLSIVNLAISLNAFILLLLKNAPQRNQDPKTLLTGKNIEPVFPDRDLALIFPQIFAIDQK
jgi:hypothetical protein